jgi:head-tail adaptor
MAASAGDMRHSVSVKNIGRTSDGGGGYYDSSTSTETVFCAIRQMSHKESFQHGKLDGQGMWEFICRKPSSSVIFQKSILEYDSKTFNVRSIINTGERDKYLIIQAEEGVAT